MNGTRICSIPECDSPFYGRTFCRMHYVRLMKHGTTDLQPRRYTAVPAAVRLLARSVPVGECIEYMGHRDKDGYGTISVRGRAIRAHRLAYAQEHGPIPAGMVVRHKCDNPPCVKGEHLELGSNWDNQQDKVVRRRSTHGEMNPGAVLTEGQVIAIYGEIEHGARTVDLAALFGVGLSTIARIRRREAWGPVIDRAYPPKAG